MHAKKGLVKWVLVAIGSGHCSTRPWLSVEFIAPHVHKNHDLLCEGRDTYFLQEILQTDLPSADCNNSCPSTDVFGIWGLMGHGYISHGKYSSCLWDFYADLQADEEKDTHRHVSQVSWIHRRLGSTWMLGWKMVARLWACIYHCKPREHVYTISSW